MNSDSEVEWSLEAGVEAELGIMLESGQSPLPTLLLKGVGAGQSGTFV